MPSDIDTLHFYCDLCFNKHLYNEIFFFDCHICYFDLGICKVCKTDINKNQFNDCKKKYPYEFKNFQDYYLQISFFIDKICKIYLNNDLKNWILFYFEKYKNILWFINDKSYEEITLKNKYIDIFKDNNLKILNQYPKTYDIKLIDEYGIFLNNIKEFYCNNCFSKNIIENYYFQWCIIEWLIICKKSNDLLEYF